MEITEPVQIFIAREMAAVQTKTSKGSERSEISVTVPILWSTARKLFMHGNIKINAL